jgi:DNA polymerase elongation subunit (family B)
MNSYIIDQKDVQKILGALSRDDLKFYQFYNIDFRADEYQYQEYMLNLQENKDEASLRLLNKTYYDIEIFYDPEIFPDPEKAAYPVNSIAVYNNMRNEAMIFVWVTEAKTKDRQTLEDETKKIYSELVQENKTYLIEDLSIKVKTYTSETDLLKDFFLYLRELNTLFLIGFNSSLFDDPYVVQRGINLYGEPIFNFISEFGEVQKYGSRSFEWPDYTKVDLLTLYRPVDQGGMGLGKSLPNYKLDTVAEVELGINKLDLEDLNKEYINNTSRFITYNLLDTLLTYKLDKKLQFLELNWMLAKYNDAPMSSAIIGRSVMYQYRNDLIYTKRNQAIRSKTFGREIFYPVNFEGAE